MSYVDEYLETVNTDERAEFERVRAIIHEHVPDIEEGKSYGMPAFIYKTKPIAAFIAAKDHLSYFPMSGSVTSQLVDELKDYQTLKGTVKYSLEKPLPKSLIITLIDTRIAELDK